MSDAPERIWALHYECEDEPDAIAIGYPEKFFGTHEYVRADRIEELEANLARIRREALEEAAGVADRMQGAGSEAIRNTIRFLASNPAEVAAILLKAAGEDRG
jgi:hypothetical protein